MNEFPILLYTTPEGGVKVNAVLKDETLWLTQGAMAELFGAQSQAITKHLLCWPGLIGVNLRTRLGRPPPHSGLPSS